MPRSRAVPPALLIAALALAPLAHAQTCAAPVADLVRGTLGGVSVRASAAQVRARLPCAAPSPSVPAQLDGPRPASAAPDAAAPFAFFVGDVRGWTLGPAFAGPTRPAVLRVPLRTALARLRQRGVRVAFPLGDTGNAVALRTRYGCLVLLADDAGRVEQVQASAHACASP